MKSFLIVSAGIAFLLSGFKLEARQKTAAKRLLYAAITLFSLSFIACEKEKYCDLYTFASLQCEPGLVQVTARHKSNYVLDPETCREMAARIIEDRRADGVFTWQGQEVPLESLVYCDCHE